MHAVAKPRAAWVRVISWTSDATNLAPLMPNGGSIIALTFINPEHMKLLYTEKMGQMMIVVAIIMQTVGYVWIRKIIKIEV